METLAPLRHTCAACGACCHNVLVRVSGAERDRLHALATELGLPDAVGPDRLHTEAGACVFLEDGWKCRIHAAYGLEAKPTMCRTFPQMVLVTEDGVRAGIDPATRAFRTTRSSGEPVPVDVDRAPRVVLPPPEARLEQALIAVARSDGSTLAHVAGLVCMGPQTATLPAGLRARVVDRLRQADFRALIEDPHVGAAPRTGLRPLADWLDAEHPPLDDRWTLDPELDAYARDAFAAQLFLRLSADSTPNVHAAALVALVGLIAAALPEPEPPAYDAAVAAWLRLTRVPRFWQTLIPTPEVLLGLIGRRP